MELQQKKILQRRANHGWISKIEAKRGFWLLFHVGEVTKDLNRLNGVGYEYLNLPEYDKYLGRLIVKYKNTSQNMIRKY